MNLSEEDKTKWANEFKNAPLIMRRYVNIIFGQIKTDEDKGVHNELVTHILSACKNEESFVEKVASSIINALQGE
jgi:hypothetical protein